MTKPLYDKGYLDGIGMQAHYPSIGNPSVATIETAVKKYASIGKDIEIQLTEMDIHNASNSLKSNNALGEMYYNIMKMLVRLDRSKAANITNVTFWGLTDDVTWLTNFKREKSYPLLFEGDFTAKDAFYRVIQASR